MPRCNILKSAEQLVIQTRSMFIFKTILSNGVYVTTKFWITSMTLESKVNV